jgi:hypothetical protein
VFTFPGSYDIIVYGQVTEGHGTAFSAGVMGVRTIQKNIDVIATFRIGEPPEPHRFRIEGLDGEKYEYRIPAAIPLADGRSGDLSEEGDP